MLKISGPVGAVAFVSLCLLSGAGSSVSIDSARADACLAAPKTAAPSGQHWYYHIERATRRKCWYLHSAAQLRHRAAIRHHTAAEPENAEPAPEPQTAAAPAVTPEPPAAVPAAPAPASAADVAALTPHVTVLAVRPATPFVSTTTPQQSLPEKASAMPAPQTLPRDQAAPANGGGKPADPVDVQPQGKTDAAFNAPSQIANAAKEDARTRTAEMFILLAFVFGAAAALIAIVSKLAGIYRRPRISDNPDTAWLSYRLARRRIDGEAGSHGQDVPFVDPQEHYGLADLHEQEWLDGSAPAQDGFSAPSNPNPDSKDALSEGGDLKSIEPALRALQQARQSR